MKTELTYTADVDNETWGFSVAHADYNPITGRYSFDWTVTRDDIVLASSYPNGDRISSYGREQLPKVLGTLLSMLSAWCEAWDSVENTGRDSDNTELFGLSLQPMRATFDSGMFDIMAIDLNGLT